MINFQNIWWKPFHFYGYTKIIKKKTKGVECESGSIKNRKTNQNLKIVSIVENFFKNRVYSKRCIRIQKGK